MVQLTDLSDDYLMEVLGRLPANQLFKMQRLNRRINRLATIKMQVNIQTISVSVFTDNLFFAKCSHLSAISPQTLVLNSKFEKLGDPSTRAFFSSILSKCAAVKCIAFGCFQVPGDILLEMFRRCPQLECLVFEKPIFEVDEWERVLDRFGDRIVHFKWWRQEEESPSQADIRVIEMMAAKCANIQRVSVSFGWFWNLPPNHFLASLKLLPKNCWIALFHCFIDQDSFEEDVVDELNAIRLFRWPKLKNRFDRLSILKARFSQNVPDSPVRGFVFANLKKLEIVNYIDHRQIIDNLLASQFPRLEEFVFKPNGLTEDVYDKLFQKMATVKKLTILYGYESGSNPLLPQSAIHHLKNLENIYLKIGKVSINLQLKEFLKQIEQYVDEIGSLKKLTVKIYTSSLLWREKKFKNKLIIDIMLLSVKQNRVEVELLEFV